MVLPNRFENANLIEGEKPFKEVSEEIEKIINKSLKQ